jgi:hypothetical protein
MFSLSLHPSLSQTTDFSCSRQVLCYSAALPSPWWGLIKWAWCLSESQHLETEAGESWVPGQARLYREHCLKTNKHSKPNQTHKQSFCLQRPYIKIGGALLPLQKVPSILSTQSPLIVSNLSDCRCLHFCHYRLPLPIRTNKNSFIFCFLNLAMWTISTSMFIYYSLFPFSSLPSFFLFWNRILLCSLW